MFYIQDLYRDRHMHKINVTTHTHRRIPHCTRPLQQYMLVHPIPAFCILQCVIYGPVSMSKQAKANSPGESPQMHTCKFNTMSHIAQPLSAGSKLQRPKLPSFSVLRRCAPFPQLSMVMLWKQNLNIYIRWL